MVKPKPATASASSLAKPSGMSPDASWLWDQVTVQDAVGQLLKPIDGPALEVACETFARWREAVAERRANGLTHENSQGNVIGPWIGIEERAATAYKTWCTEFGFTPLSRGALKNNQEPGGADHVDTLDELKAQRQKRRPGAA